LLFILISIIIILIWQRCYGFLLNICCSKSWINYTSTKCYLFELSGCWFKELLRTWWKDFFSIWWGTHSCRDYKKTINMVGESFNSNANSWRITNWLWM